jgi:hypothetical protein
MKKKSVLFFIILFSCVSFNLQAQNAPTFFSVKSYGATGDKSQKATSFIQKAIDACATAGGGTVYFPAGEYLSGQINLKSNVTIELEAGAVLYASQDAKDFTITENYIADNQAKTPNKTYLIYGDNLKNITIKGKGTIDGQARHTWEDLRSVDGFIQQETEIARKSGIEMKRAYVQEPKVRLVYLNNITNLHVENITLQHSPDWTLHIGGSSHVVIRGIKVFSSLTHGANADGIDIDGGKNIHISDCTVETGDDAICLKTTYNEGKPVPLENVTVTNCTLTATSCALKLGTESYADFKNILFNNCVITNSNRGIGIFVRDGANVSNVIFSNLTIECNRKHFNWWGDGEMMRFVVLKRNAESLVGSIKNVTVTNVIAKVQGTSLIAGFEGKALENITLENIQLAMEAEQTADKRATDAIKIEKVNGLDVKNVTVQWDTQKVEPKWGASISLTDVKDVLMSALKVGSAPNSKAEAIRFYNVTNAIVERCVALPNTNIFLSFLGKTSEITTEDNYLKNATQKYLIGEGINDKKNGKKKLSLD